MGIGSTSPIAKLNIAAGTATVAPLMFTDGTNLTTPVSGAIEFDGTSLYYTDSGNVRHALGTTGGTGGGQTSTSVLTFNSNSDGSGGDGGFNFQSNGANLVTISNTGDIITNSTTVSTSSTTGALKVAGGMGVAGDIFAGATVNAGTSMTTPQIYGSSAASGTIKIDGTSNATKGNILLNSGGGDVGIGVGAATFALHVGATDTSALVQAFNRSSTAARYPAAQVMNYDGTGYGGYPVFQLVNGRGNSTTPSAVQTGDSLGAFVVFRCCRFKLPF